jgi:fibronectin type 3 domain-containing protein
MGYNTYSSTTTGGPYTKLTSTPTPGTTYTDSTVKSGLTYYYVLTAVDSSGVESSYSTQISAIIP